MGEPQRGVAGVLDEDLVVDGLAEFARQGEVVIKQSRKSSATNRHQPRQRVPLCKQQVTGSIPAGSIKTDAFGDRRIMPDRATGRHQSLSGTVVHEFLLGAAVLVAQA